MPTFAWTKSAATGPLRLRPVWSKKPKEVELRKHKVPFKTQSALPET